MVWKMCGLKIRIEIELGYSSTVNFLQCYRLNFMHTGKQISKQNCCPVTEYVNVYVLKV